MKECEFCGVIIEASGGHGDDCYEKMKKSIDESRATTVVLYFAIHGWGAPVECHHLDEESDDFCDSPDVVGLNSDDGRPLCSKHIDDPEEEGVRFPPGVVEEIKRRRLELYKEHGEDPRR